MKFKFSAEVEDTMAEVFLVLFPQRLRLRAQYESYVLPKNKNIPRFIASPIEGGLLLGIYFFHFPIAVSKIKWYYMGVDI